MGALAFDFGLHYQQRLLENEDSPPHRSFSWNTLILVTTWCIVLSFPSSKKAVFLRPMKDFTKKVFPQSALSFLHPPFFLINLFLFCSLPPPNLFLRLSDLFS